MNEQQAIKILKEEKSWESDNRKIDAFNIGINALEKQIKIKEILNTPTLFAEKFDRIRELEKILLN